MTLASPRVGPLLPAPAGPLSAAIFELLRRPAGTVDGFDRSVVDGDPYGRDVQLALYVCYELHYRGFGDVDPSGNGTPPYWNYAHV